MAEEPRKLLDDVGWRILAELQQNARISFTELGRRVGLSTPAVLERVRKLEETGIIRGYHADVDRTKAGMPITAFIRLSVVGEVLHRIIAVAERMDEVLECHRITGSDSFLIKVGVSSVEHLQRLFDQLSPYVATTTSIVLSSPVERRVIVRGFASQKPVREKKRLKAITPDRAISRPE